MREIKHLLYKGSSLTPTTLLTSDTLVMLGEELIALSPFAIVGMSFAAREAQYPAAKNIGFATFLWDIDKKAKKEDSDKGWDGYKFLPGFCHGSAKDVTYDPAKVRFEHFNSIYVLLRNGSPVFQLSEAGLYIWRQTGSWIAAQAYSSVDLPDKADVIWFLTGPDTNTMPESPGQWTLHTPKSPTGAVIPLPEQFQFYFTHTQDGGTSGSPGPQRRIPLNATLSFPEVKAWHSVHTNASNKAISPGVREA